MSTLPRPRFIGFLLVLAVAGGLAPPVLPPERALVTGIDLVAICIAALVMAWLSANLDFAFHFSHHFQDQLGGVDRRGLVFPGTDEPAFADFCCFSLVIGMTCQMPDVTITDAALRRTVTLQGLAAFFFNLGVQALAVNLAASAS